jgi:hypothetical protein
MIYKCNSLFLVVLILLFLIIINIVYDYLYKEYEHYSNDEFVVTFQSVQNMMSDMNMSYAITYGTALGAYRNNDFIPHDDDIDIIIFYDDLISKGHSSIEEQKNFFNTNAKKYNLIPKFEHSAPYIYIKEDKGMPILYQYIHENTKIGVDFYIFYKFENDYWNFSEGGENDFKGYKYPISDKFFKTKLNIFETMSCPIEYLHISYGPNIDAHIKKGDDNYHHEERYFFGDFKNEWLMKLK